MTLRLEDKWVWDFWFAVDGDEYHVFYLQAPRSLGSPNLRHRHASIGHAVSTDLRTWSVLPDAVLPGTPGSWDDLAVWTGSVIRRGDTWYMFYTGISSRDQGRVQRIGLAVSQDLIAWRKHPANPVLEADPRWYELLDLSRWRDQSWRDPWVFYVREDDSFHLLVTARVPYGPPDEAGVVGHAQSADLVNWTVLPPLTQPGEFAQAEVPQLVYYHDTYALLVSCLAEDHSRKRRAEMREVAQTGTFVAYASDFRGPYTCFEGPLVPADNPLGPLYAGKLLRAGDQWWYFAFRGDDSREFHGELIDPLRVGQTASSRLAVEHPRGLVHHDGPD